MATLGFCFALKLSTKHQRRKGAKGVRAHEGRTDCRRFGWLVSLTLHCGALALALHGMSELRMREKPHVFQWDVLLATVTPAADPIPASVVEKQALSPSATSPQSAPPRKETTASSVQPGIIDRAPIIRSSHPMARQTSFPARMTREITTEQTQAVETTVLEGSEVTSHTARHELIANQPAERMATKQTHAIVSDQASVVQQQVETHPTTQEIREAEFTDVHSIVPVVQASVAYEPSVVQVDTEALSRKVSVVPVVEARAQPRAAAVVTEIDHHRQMEARPAAESDFSWLAESLWSRIEDLKRYPALARSRRWEGRVVVEAVIRHDGEIVRCHIAESSGHGVLDDDALTVLRRASPLPLKHSLGREEITIFLPITYRLHG